MGLLDAPPFRPAINPDAVALRRWFTALAGRNAAPANFLVLGDSVMEKDRGGTTEAGRIVSLLRDQLQVRYTGTKQGAGYIPASPYNVASAWTYGGTLPTISTTFGLGRMSSILTAGSTTTATITVFCDRFQILGLGSSTGTVAIDGGIPVALTVTAAGVDGRVVFDSGTLTPGFHTVVCAAPATGAHFYLNGAVFFLGDFASGIRKWESANSGSQALYLLPPAYGGVAGGPITTSPYWADVLDTVKPDLVILEFGLNEQLTAPTRTPAQLRADLANLVTVINAKTPGRPPSVLPLIMWAHGFGGSADAVWLPYRAAIKEAATANGWAMPVDIYDTAGYIGSSTGPVADRDPYALTTDYIHPKPKGNQLIVDEIIRRIAPAPVAPAAVETAPLPWVHELDAFGPSQVVNPGAGVVYGAMLYSGWVQGHPNGSELYWDVILAAGTWQVTLTYGKNTNAGIYTVVLDGVTVGTVDSYAAAQANNTITSIAGVAVSRTGKHRFGVKLPTRNASATANYAFLQHVQLRRTA